jgi:hypothetical protein
MVSGRTATAAVRKPWEGAQLAIASVRENSAREWFELPKSESFGSELTRLVYICLQAVLGQNNLKCVW